MFIIDSPSQNILKVLPTLSVSKLLGYYIPDICVISQDHILTYIWFIVFSTPHIIHIMKKVSADLKVALGDKIRNLRRIKGLTQEELGEKAGLSYKYIGEIEQGQVNVSFDSLIRIVNALSVMIGDLFPSETAMSQKILIKDKSPLSKLSSQDIQTIKHALRLLNRVFAKV